MPLPIPANSARIVFSAQVLEHVEKPQVYLDECRRLLTNDGMLLLSTHGFWTYHGYPNDFRRWTRPGLICEVESCGFSVIEVICCLGPLAYSTHLRTQLLRGFLYTLSPALGRLLCPPLHAASAMLMELEELITPRSIAADNAVAYVLAARRAYRPSLPTGAPLEHR